MTSTPDEPVRDEDFEAAPATPGAADSDLGYSGGEGATSDEDATAYLDDDLADGTFGEGTGPTREQDGDGSDA